MNWEMLVGEQNGKVPEWPYSVDYGKENKVKTDILVLGGGIAGCWAAISAARKGLKVVLVEKGATIRSGAGGTGCDHWLYTPNPCSNLTAQDMVEAELAFTNGYLNCITRYIAAKESYDTLLELEKMGAKIRDTEDEFKGADFRDEKSKFLFCYDYENKVHFRVWGATFKLALYQECKRLGVQIYDRIQATSLLTEGGRQGGRVIGATGLNVRTGEFNIFSAKATVFAMSRHQRNWVFSSELTGLCGFRPGIIVGNGFAMAWRAGAQLSSMERSGVMTYHNGYSYPHYGVGMHFTTWLPCTMVDADGKELPWFDAYGRPLSNISERTRPTPEQKFLGDRARGSKQYRHPEIPDNMADRIRRGEFKLPLYADLPSMPDQERRVIFGMMVGSEGKTQIPVLKAYTESGFDPTKDMLQSYILLRGDARGDTFLPGMGIACPQERVGGEFGESCGGIVVNWDLMTSLEGMFAAGDAVFASNYHHQAAATGRYAGRKAAEYAINAGKPVIVWKQIDEVKARVYDPVTRKDGVEWKELNAVGCRIMQNYCGDIKNSELLNIGLNWLRNIQTNEVPRVYANNPHKLARTVDVMDILTVDEIIIEASLARRASSMPLGFKRQDFPEMDPPEWHKFLTVRLQDGKVDVGELPLDFAGDLEENYRKHNEDCLLASRNEKGGAI